MPTAVQSTSSTFADFEEKRYTLRIVEAVETTSPPPDNRPQHMFTCALEGTEDPERGDEITRRVYVSFAWNDNPEKLSHQVILARALYGPGVTLDEWNAVDYDALVGQRFSAFVKLDAKGWPAVDKESMKPAPQAKAAPPARAATPPAAPAAPPPAPAAPADDGMTDKTRQRIAKLIAASEYDESEVAAHCQREFGAAAWEGLTEGQGRHLTAQLVEGELIPF